MIKGVVFDMDGLMFDTEKLSKEGWEYAGIQTGYCISDELFSKMLGTNKDSIIKLFEKEFGIGKDFTKLRKLRFYYLMQYINEHGMPIKEGLLELLGFLKNSGYKFTVATSTDEKYVRYYLEKAGIAGYFGEIVCGDTEERGKPEPDIYLKAAKILGLPPSECLALEDSPFGILSAYRAGMKPVMIPDMVMPDKDTEKLLYAKLKSLSEVIDLLKKTL